jgi:hypothetical protein
MKFRKGLPDYLDLMDKMFIGNIVDSSTSFVASDSDTINLDGASSDEAATNEQPDLLTPLSVGNKWSSSTSTTASSPNKRSKSPAVRSLDNTMRTHNKIANRRLCLLENMLDIKKQKIEMVTQLAREMGIGAQTPTLFRGLHNVILNESEMDFFLTCGPEERMMIIEQAAPVDP